MLPRVTEARFARWAMPFLALLALEEAPHGSVRAISLTPIAIAAAATVDRTPQREAPPAPPAEVRSREGKAMTLHLASGNEPHLARANAWAYVPRSFDPASKNLHVAVLFHGFQNCIESYVSAEGQV